MAKERFIKKSTVVLPVLALVLASCAQGDGAGEVASEAATTSSVAVAQEGTTETTATPTPVTTKAGVTRSTSAPAARRSGDTGPPAITYDPNAPREPDVRTSPLKIPAITEKQGFPIAVIMPEIVAAISQVCQTPTLCVTLATEKDADPNSNFSVCQFVETVPNFKEALVPRGSTVTVVIGSRPAKVGPPCTTDFEGSRSL